MLTTWFADRRRVDIRLLALHFTSRDNQAHQRNVHLAADALERLDWPGNIRSRRVAARQ